jgi:hypothetical protein
MTAEEELEEVLEALEVWMIAIIREANQNPSMNPVHPQLYEAKRNLALKLVRLSQMTTV